jgi:hypothetical protein
MAKKRITWHPDSWWKAYAWMKAGQPDVPPLVTVESKVIGNG